MFILCDLRQCNASLPCADGNAGKTASKAEKKRSKSTLSSAGMDEVFNQPAAPSLIAAETNQSIEKAKGIPPKIL